MRGAQPEIHEAVKSLLVSSNIDASAPFDGVGEAQLMSVDMLAVLRVARDHDGNMASAVRVHQGARTTVAHREVRRHDQLE